MQVICQQAPVNMLTIPTINYTVDFAIISLFLRYTRAKTNHRYHRGAWYQATNSAICKQIHHLAILEFLYDLEFSFISISLFKVSKSLEKN